MSSIWAVAQAVGGVLIALVLAVVFYLVVWVFWMALTIGTGGPFGFLALAQNEKLGNLFDTTLSFGPPLALVLLATGLYKSFRDTAPIFAKAHAYAVTLIVILELVYAALVLLDASLRVSFAF